MSSHNPDQLLSARDIAAELSVAIETPRRWMASGELRPLVRFGRLVRIRRRDLDRFLNTRNA